jgi:aryl-alcohol dehydrogenase-like predicted oxidoreductase
MPWGPLRSGFLSGKYSSSTTGPVDTTRAQLVGSPRQADYAVIDVLNEVAREVGGSSAAVALAWVRGRPGVTSTVLGARRLDQLQANLAALDITLTESQRATLDEVSTPSLNFPAENNRTLSRTLQFAGATVDGIPSAVSPLLHANAARY